TASLTAAAIRSSSTSLSSVSRLSSMVTRRTSWRPVITTDTRPAPDWPVTSAFANSSCIFCIFSCICCACFIRPAMPPFIMSVSSGRSGLFQGFDGAFSDHCRELLHQLLNQRIGLDRLFGCLLTLRTIPSSRLSRGFLLGFLQLDHQLQGTTVILIERLVQPSLLGGVKQRTLRRVQVHYPAVIFNRNQRAVGCDASGQSGQAKL